MIAFPGEIDNHKWRLTESGVAEIFLQAIAAHDLAEDMQDHVDALLRCQWGLAEAKQLLRLKRNISYRRALLRSRLVNIYQTMLLLSENCVFVEKLKE